jgi:hypothetical protein
LKISKDRNAQSPRRCYDNKQENRVLKLLSRCFLPLIMLVLAVGCGSYQPTKNAWKSTKGFWNAYVSPPAEVNYEEKGDLSPQTLALTNSMIGVDIELERLERTMLNADKPPTRAWVTDFFTKFPWINGFAGVRYDGTILGQEPASPMKQLDFIPLLYEDKKQNSRALRGDTQNTPLGPEILLATPLYDSVDFLGIVLAHFDIRTLMLYSGSPENIVVLSPQALLWAGKYDFAATPLAGVNWEEVVSKSSSGVCKNATGSFYYIVRYLGNLPLVFAVPESGAFPEGDGDISKALAFFPKEREKLPPPPQPEKKAKDTEPEGQQVDLPAAKGPSGGSGGVPAAATAEQHGARDIQPGSSESALLKKQTPAGGRRMEERHLEGENVPVERVQRPRRAPRPETGASSAADLTPRDVAPAVQRPSPFGPREEEQPPAPVFQRPSPFGPDAGSPAPSQAEPQAREQPEIPAADSQNAADPEKQPEAAPAPENTGGQPTGNASQSTEGRPSPFGPKN